MPSRQAVVGARVLSPWPPLPGRSGERGSFVSRGGASASRRYREGRCNLVVDQGGHDLRQRHGDLVWRVRFRDEQWLYLVLLLEFQSNVDRSMAVRMLTYTGLLYQRLIDEGVLREHGALPPVLPIIECEQQPTCWPTSSKQRTEPADSATEGDLRCAHDSLPRLDRPPATGAVRRLAIPGARPLPARERPPDTTPSVLVPGRPNLSVAHAKVLDGGAVQRRGCVPGMGALRGDAAGATVMPEMGDKGRKRGDGEPGSG